MYQPEGYNDNTGRVCKLNKSLYGLKQAPKNWNDKFSTFLKTLGLENTDDDPCIYSTFLKTLGLENTDDDPCIYYSQDRRIIIALFVDDGLVVGKNVKDMLQILNQLGNKFEITFDNSMKDSISYLGMEIRVSQHEIFVSQAKYTKSILQRFKFDTMNATATPIERGMLTDEGNFVNDRPLSKSVPYREVIGSLLYLATISRPDISFAVNYLSRFNSKPMESNWAAGFDDLEGNWKSSNRMNQLLYILISNLPFTCSKTRTKAR
ncbi:Reverse transcriptase (RNA-dependent DNA polymerase) [Popillia japonica]|uniref:Reverse transcriptase (RNA-dependent DNA polymerase) n=1 Tax=Popillia japonica TaxID=7064 RepID=A0AAW1JET9_POPJA